MANVGTVQSVTGVVRAVAKDGSERILKAGDSVAENEKIITGDGVVVIAFIDGTVLDLGSNSNVVLNEDVLSPGGEQTVQSEALANGEVAALQEVLINNPNFDPTTELPATAAGTPAAGAADNDGHATVSVDYLNPKAPVAAGFDTIGISQEFQQPEEDLPPVIDESGNTPSLTTVGLTDIAYEFTITNHDEVSSAGYKSSYGYYIKGADGSPTTGVVVWDNVQGNDTATPVTVTGYSPDQIGFFIIPNGDNRNHSLGDQTPVTFKFVDGSGNEVAIGTAGGQWQAFDGATALSGNGSHVLFDAAALNVDSENHVVNNGLTGNQNWEDLPILTGDGDFNDVNVNVEWTSVTATGNAADAQFGADGPGSVDFSLGAVTILGNLTSNGENIFFEARDTDADGNNDLIVGRTASGDVLTIDGILDSSDYDIKLLGPIDSSNSGSGDVQIIANAQVTDSDGDIATVVLNFNIDVNIMDGPPVDTTL